MLMIGPSSCHVVEALLLLGLCEAGCELNQGEMDTATVQSLVQQSPLAKPAQVAPISPCLVPATYQRFCKVLLFDSKLLWSPVPVLPRSMLAWQHIFPCRRCDYNVDNMGVALAWSSFVLLLGNNNLSYWRVFEHFLQLHGGLCRVLDVFVRRLQGLGPALDVECIHFQKSGVQALCALQLALDKARSLLHYCADSSKLYLVGRLHQCPIFTVLNGSLSCSHDFPAQQSVFQGDLCGHRMGDLQTALSLLFFTQFSFELANYLSTSFVHEA